MGQGTPSAEGRAGLGRQSSVLSGSGFLGEQQPPLSPAPPLSQGEPGSLAWGTRENSTQRPHVTYVGTLLDWLPANKHFHLTAVKILVVPGAVLGHTHNTHIHRLEETPLRN